MKIAHEDYDQISVIKLNGELTADELDPLRRVVNDRLGSNVRDFVVEMSQLDFVDSRGLETLLWLQDQAGENLGQVRLVNPPENVRKILQMTRLDKCFDTHQDVDSALKSLR
ncbi:MAG: anti-sigma factor antagonist [Planctomycetes bacterium]|nr:anti-sigma factor antagonist [Planctomycetota bacterium]